MNFRIHPQIDFNFDELIIDSFAGGGGASTGIEAALGRPIDIAINYDPAALRMHLVNHPRTRHLCESVWDVDPIEATKGQPVGLAWFSPDCTHFSKAKGGKPVKKNIRGLAWIVLRWAAKVRPRIIMLENVEEFKTWGPLGNDGRPCKKRKGQTFEKWKQQLKDIGYQVEHRELRACDYGAPTIRKRLFVIARCDGQPIIWPTATHGKDLKPYKTAADIIDWSIPCLSIFERKRPLVENTMRRIARGIQKFVIENPKPFIVRIGQTKFGGNGMQYPINSPLTTIVSKAKHCLVTPFISTYYGLKCENDVRGSTLNVPIATLTTENRHALCTAFLAQHNLGAIGRKADDPLSTITARGTQQQVVAAHMIRHFCEGYGHGVKKPVATITPGGLGKTGLVTSHLLKMRGTCQHGQKVEEPIPTITAGGLHIGEVRAFLMKYYGTGGQWQDMNDPIHTLRSKVHMGLVTVKGQDYQIVDIGIRMLTPRELFDAQGFPENYIIDRDAEGNNITKTAQVKFCGNSVPPSFSEALVRANYVNQIIKKTA